MIRDCEVMVKIICKSSLLKGHDYRLKRNPHGSKMCILCDLGCEDNAVHLVMQCTFNEDIRLDMYNALNVIDNEHVRRILGTPAEFFHILVGKHPEGVPFEVMKGVWEISSRLISKMYRRSVKKHAEYEKRYYISIVCLLFVKFPT